MHESTGTRDQVTVENAPSRALTSWKEVASYIGKSVRTVQRWEAELGLPIRRPNPGDRNVVVAIPAELDRWLLRRLTPRANTVDGCNRQLERMRELVTVMITETERTRERTSDLLERMKQTAGKAAERKKFWSIASEAKQRRI